MFQAGVRHSHQKSVAHLSALGDLPATRARPDILPEHESRWPVTDEVRAAIEADWDGSAGSARDLGQRFHSPIDSSTYPSWRIADMAQQMGVYATKVSARVQANVDELYPEPPAPRGKQPRRQAEHDAPTGITTLAAALKRVDEQLASGDGDTGILAVEREALRDLAAKRAGHETRTDSTDSGERTEQAMTATTVLTAGAVIEERHETTAVVIETPAATPATPATVAPGSQPRRYDKRQAACEQCGATFTSVYRGNPIGWTRYCSAGCGGAARWKGVKRSGKRHDRGPVPTRVVTSPTDVRISMATPITPAVAAVISAEAVQAEAKAVRVAAGPDLPTPFVAALPAPIPAAPTLPPTKGIDAIPGLLVATLRRLPASREWTTRERARWIALFAAALDYEITVTDEDEGE